MAYLDRSRAQALISEAGFDAIILLSPESFYYATGASAGVATMWRTAGAVAVLVPADATAAETAVVSDLFADNFRRNSHIKDIRQSPIWVETTTVDLRGSESGKTADHPATMPAPQVITEAWNKAGRSSGFNRPATYDAEICYRHLSDALTEQGLTKGRIGFEGAAVSVSDFPLLQQTLSNYELVDASHLIATLKMIKCDDEITNLRQAVTLAEHGIVAVRDAISGAVTRNELATVWQSAVEKHQGNTNLTSHWEYISVGPDPWGGNAAAQDGDLIKVDVGCLVDGYTSDTGRTFVLGKAGAYSQQLYAALLQGFEAGRKLLKPGVLLSEIHAATLSAIRAAGYPQYTRGHFGHGLGAGTGSEQWPFIAANSNIALQPGMVMAFECPWYINGLGGMIVENQLLITENGHEMMNTLPTALVEIR